VSAAKAQQTRSFAGAAGKAYKEKTFYEAWCSDAGAYPVMSVIGFAVVFSFGTGFAIMFTHPDARFSKGSRSQIFRGELRHIKADE